MDHRLQAVIRKVINQQKEYRQFQKMISPHDRGDGNENQDCCSNYCVLKKISKESPKKRRIKREGVKKKTHIDQSGEKSHHTCDCSLRKSGSRNSPLNTQKKTKELFQRLTCCSHYNRALFLHLKQTKQQHRSHPLTWIFIFSHCDRVKTTDLLSVNIYRLSILRSTQWFTRIMAVKTEIRCSTINQLKWPHIEMISEEMAKRRVFVKQPPFN